MLSVFYNKCLKFRLRLLLASLIDNIRLFDLAIFSTNSIKRNKALEYKQEET